MQTSDVIIHIGYPKVASSWLQRCVFIPAHGFQTPWATHSNAAIEHFVHTPLPFFNAEIIRNDFLAACAPSAGAPVISHEALAGDPIRGSYGGFEAVRRLAETFPGARLVVFVRTQESYAYSAWCEHVRRGGLTSINAYLDDKDVAPGYRPFCPPEFLRYNELIGYCAELFGHERVLALPLEAMASGKVLNHLSAFLDNEKLLEAANERVYRSLSGGTTRILRQLNRFAPYDPTQRDGRGFLLRQSARLDRHAPKAWQYRCKKGDQKKIAALLSGRYAEANRELQALTPIDLSQFTYQL